MKKEVKEIFSNRLKFYRKSKNLTQEQLASLVGTTPQTLSGLETKYSFPSYSILNKIISSLDVKPYKLFLDEDDLKDIQDDEYQIILIEKFKNLSKDNQKIILTMLDALGAK